MPKPIKLLTCGLAASLLAGCAADPWRTYAVTATERVVIAGGLTKAEAVELAGETKANDGLKRVRIERDGLKND